MMKRLKKFAGWIFVIVITWWLISSILPGFPTPVHAAKSILSIVKDVSDDLYLSANRKNLEEAARQVMLAAEESNVQDDYQFLDDNRIIAERKKRLPLVPLHEDSSLRAEMENLSSVPFIGGKVINVLIVGIDSRIGSNSARADAMHLATINPEAAVVEIMSIPRDTYCDLGYPDTTSFNIIANARGLGLPGLMKRVEELTNLGPVKYYVEVGFSQALGVLEILGYRDPVNTLKFLRNRRAMAGGDVQRSHNQAVFLRQNLIEKFSLLTGATGDLVLSAGLHFVNTNLTKEFCQGLLYTMEQRGFPNHRSDAVRLRMLPKYKMRLREMLADSMTIAQTLERTKKICGEEEGPYINVVNFLRRANQHAITDSSRPGLVIHRLRRLNEQHAWIQIQDPQIRQGVRDTLITCLEKAYRKVGKHQEADRVLAGRKAEDLLLQKK